MAFLLTVEIPIEIREKATTKTQQNKAALDGVFFMTCSVQNNRVHKKDQNKTTLLEMICNSYLSTAKQDR